MDREELLMKMRIATKLMLLKYEWKAVFYKSFKHTEQTCKLIDKSQQIAFGFVGVIDSKNYQYQAIY